jgi:hypothetical protein
MKLNSEDIIILNEFKARDYQEPILDAIFNRGIRRMVVTLPRRAGKDVALWNCAIRQCLLKPCLVLYVCPSHRLGKRNVWDMIGMDGKRFADYIPERLILKKNESEMKITFKNNSILQVVGALNHDDSIRGGNPTGVVLSEYAYYKDGTILDTVSPIIAANPDAWLVLASTPQGKNHFYQIWTIAQQLKDWWTYKKTVDDTKHISPENLEAERMRMSPEMFMQEYYCSFDRGIDGAIFGKALNHLRLNEHITHVTHQPQLLTHVSIDIGLSKGNATTIIWFQVVGDGQIINIIDCYSSENLGLDFYAALLQERQVKYGYKMGVYLAPHDLAVREWGAGAVTRYEKARQLDINFTILDQHLLADQIENALTHFPKVWIDERKCKALIDALENYHRIWDEERGVYSQKPAHTWASNYASSFMGIFLGLHHTYSGRSADDYERLRQESHYGGSTAHLPRIFRQGIKEIMDR